ncbi:hypothetical protein OHA77_26195 [Streptosporangium sp. NBC_01639]|uniref:hypothetical protein n=1 Tax=Streptosporangium sp. NBC_01639 TaxID=2975948 RepID=UPI00387018E5|nr:hypothetical protein OHA77_26195 [Streptosporangium sp. NBC_01639]
MPTIKSVVAGLAISTALAGGIVGLGAATTMTTANAAVAQTTIAGFQAHCGGGCGWRRCGCGGGCHRGCHHRREHFRVRVITNNHNTNIVRGNNDQRQAQRQFQWDREDAAERAALAEGGL